MPTLNWIGKEAVVRHHKDVPFRLLEPVPGLSCGANNGADSGNLIVQGDNLHALKALLPRYAGQVKCIYIDPPYNTGNEGWVYNDNVNSPEIRKWLGAVVGKEGETLDRHDRWLCMMYPRLVLLRQFLKDDGVIFINIGTDELANLGVLADEIFGASNRIAVAAWETSYTANQTAKHISETTDFVFIYARSFDSAAFGKWGRTEDQLAKFKNPDDDPRGPWKAENLSAGKPYSAGQFEIIGPTGKQFSPPPGRYWRCNESQYKEWLADGRITFGVGGTGRPMLKKYREELTQGLTATTWWRHEEFATAKEATIELKAILDGRAAFATPKPAKLIQRILQIATDKDSIVLDSFAGAGTTGHAVLKQNVEDGGTRRFILVEMDKGIAEAVTAERIRRVSTGYTNAKGEAVPGLGSGFQFCRLSAEPLFDAEGQIRSDVTFAQLAEFVWFAETGTGFSGRADSPLLGVHEGRAIYLLYNGILKDRSEGGGNVLTGPVLDLLPGFDGPKTIYAAANRLGARTAREGIVFKQTPYALEV
jgi:site-specific DNA-methyltransferase (adenine-specific)/adenine-specific DNA-methyltransferase